MTKDTRIAYGAHCGWWGPIYETGKTFPKGQFSLPCCPTCGGVLFECQSIAEWNDLLDRTETQGFPNYRAMMEWSRDQKFHFTRYEELVVAYTTAMGAAL